MNKGFIYKITNIVNDNFYIGSTNNFKRRMFQHKSQLKNNKHSNKKLQNSYNKYGLDNFKFEIVEECEDRFIREQFFIDTLTPVFNIIKTAGGGGAKWSEERKKETKEKNRMSRLFVDNGPSGFGDLDYLVRSSDAWYESGGIDPIM